MTYCNEPRIAFDLLNALRPYACHGMLEWTADGRPFLAPLVARCLPEAEQRDEASRCLASANSLPSGTVTDSVSPLLLIAAAPSTEPTVVRQQIARGAQQLEPGGRLLVALPADGPTGEDCPWHAAVLRETGLRVRTVLSLGAVRLLIAYRHTTRPRIALLPDAAGACLQIRTLGPLEHLAARGEVDLCVLPQRPELSLLLDKDLLLLQRFAGVDQLALLLKARAHGIRTALELDDDFFNLPWYNPAASTFNMFEARLMLEALVRGVHGVVTSTPYLMQRMATRNPRVVTLHNLVDTQLFKPLARASSAPETTTTFGYIGTKTHEEDLRPLLRPLKELILAGQGQVRAAFIGHVPDELARLPGVRYMGWFATYHNAAVALARSGANVALAPLADFEFNRSKSAMKYLEYGACGIPCVFSDVEAYRGFVEHGRNGWLVGEHTESAWRAALEHVVNEPDERRRLATHAFRDVVQHHSIDARAGDLLELYRQIIDDEIEPRDTVAAATASSSATPMTVVLHLHEPPASSLPILGSMVRELPKEIEVVVIAGDDGLAQLIELSELVPVVRRAAWDEQPQRNSMAAAAALARGEWLLYLDSRVKISTGLIAELQRLVGGNVAAVGPRGRHATSAQSVQALLGEGFAADPNLEEILRERARTVAATPTTLLEPDCVLLHRPSVEAAGGIDPKLVWEDALTDLCQRLSQNGREVLIGNGAFTEAIPRDVTPPPATLRTASRQRLSEKLEPNNTLDVDVEPARTFGCRGESLEVWVWARASSTYLGECLSRIRRHTDLPYTLHVLHEPDDTIVEAAIAEHGAQSHPRPAGATEPLSLLYEGSSATHLAFLHDGIYPTPNWLRAMLNVLVEKQASVVVPSSNGGSSEQRWLIDRGIALEDLDSTMLPKTLQREQLGQPIHSAAGFCWLVDLERRSAASTRPRDVSTLVSAGDTDQTWVANRAYVHVLDHPGAASAGGFGLWPGGPFDVPLEIGAGPPLQRLRNLLTALRASPWNAAVLGRVGQVYMELGDLGHARSFVSRARRLDPFSPGLRSLEKGVRKQPASPSPVLARG